MKGKKAFLSTEEPLGLFLGAVTVGVLLLLFFAIFSPMFNKEKETGKSYINSLKEEIAKVDKGEVGNFKMVLLRYGEEKNLADSVKNREIVSSYLIYFAGKLGINAGGHVFLAPSWRDKTLICVCAWSGKKGSVCGLDQCITLKAPATLKDSSGADSAGEKWSVAQGLELKITFEGGKYVFTKV